MKILDKLLDALDYENQIIKDTFEERKKDLAIFVKKIKYLYNCEGTSIEFNNSTSYYIGSLEDEKGFTIYHNTPTINYELTLFSSGEFKLDIKSNSKMTDEEFKELKNKKTPRCILYDICEFAKEYATYKIDYWEEYLETIKCYYN